MQNQTKSSQKVTLGGPYCNQSFILSVIPSHSTAAYSLDFEQESGSHLQSISDFSDPVQENSDGKNERDGKSMNVPCEPEYSEMNVQT